MARSKGTNAARSRVSAKSGSSPPPPFKRAPESLRPFTRSLSEKHVYVTHVDSKPAAFKRKIFAVPVLMNICVALLFTWRIYYILPYYIAVAASSLGYPNDTTVSTADLEWQQLAWIVLRRGFTFLLDFCLFVFVWPWPVEFTFGRRHGSPMQWRWSVGFRDKEIYVRRSRSWDAQLGDPVADAGDRAFLMGRVKRAASPVLLHEKTGYVTMNGEWNLDWEAMAGAHRLVDGKDMALEAFQLAVLLHHHELGWLCVDMGTGTSTGQSTGQSTREEERRRQVFAFRDALAAIGKEDLFFRWIEIVQFETSRPDGFGPEKQARVAQNIRLLFQQNGVDFDELWRETVGSDSSVGII